VPGGLVEAKGLNGLNKWCVSFKIMSTKRAAAAAAAAAASRLQKKTSSRAKRRHWSPESSCAWDEIRCVERLVERSRKLRDEARAVADDICEKSEDRVSSAAASRGAGEARSVQDKDDSTHSSHGVLGRGIEVSPMKEWMKESEALVAKSARMRDEAVRLADELEKEESGGKERATDEEDTFEDEPPLRQCPSKRPKFRHHRR